jgi:hypothetical protein
MQLTLSSTPFAKPSVVPKPASPQARPRDAAVMSQLDQIAAQNLQASRQGLGASAIFLALIGGFVILGSASMWNSDGEASRKPPPAVVEAAAMPAAPVVVSVAPAVAAAPQAVAAAVVEPSAPAVKEPMLAAAVAADPAVAADDVARQARAVKAAEVRRKAAQLAQERGLAEEAQRLQLAQQREADRAQQQQLAELGRQRAATEQARLLAAQSVAPTRRGVGELCAAGGFISQQFCRTRECGKAEQQGDAICVRLRDDEAAQRRASAER